MSASGAFAVDAERRAELDALFADLVDESASVAPVDAAERAARRARAAELLGAAQVDALLVEPGATMAWLAGVEWKASERLFALALLASGELAWVCPAFEAARAGERAARAGAEGALVAWQEHEHAWRPLADALRARDVRRIALDPSARSFVHHHVAAALGADAVVFGGPLVAALRGRKDEHELALLRRANELTQRAIVAVARVLAPGTSDVELGEMLRRAQERLGLRDVWVLPLVGPESAEPHGAPRGTRLARGDVVLVDTGGALHGYQSDNTRTWSFGGQPSAELERVWNAVRDAQKRAFEALQVGAPCAGVDRAARAALDAAGYGAGYALFTHRVGHGIGLEGHEPPYLDGGNEEPLAPGMTFSDEPGVYQRGRFGVRIEDIVAVAQDGPLHFGAWQRSPASPEP